MLKNLHTKKNRLIFILKPFSVIMIYVNGLPFERSSPNQGTSDLESLMVHPALVSASHSLRAVFERKFSASEAFSDGVAMRKHVYLFQREYATVDPAFVDLIGTDEATTCVGIVIRNRESGMTSLAHMDSPEIVDNGLSQMMSKLVDHKLDSELDVHLIGGFEDVSSNCDDHDIGSGNNSKTDGHSFPLCSKIIDALIKSPPKFHIQTLFVLSYNTRRDSDGVVLPIFTGFMVETLTGAVIPATFDETTRCPDELVRRIRLSASFEDPRWRGKLLETYDTETDRFIIAPCSWSVHEVHRASVLQKLPDSDILNICSTSPSAEAPDFLLNQRRQWKYLIQHPNWKETFPKGKPRIFKRNTTGNWTRVAQAAEDARV